jgi:uncharacterized protein YjbI with pentapeptide repeats
MCFPHQGCDFHCRCLCRPSFGICRLPQDAEAQCQGAALSNVVWRNVTIGATSAMPTGANLKVPGLLGDLRGANLKSARLCAATSPTPILKVPTCGANLRNARLSRAQLGSNA